MKNSTKKLIVILCILACTGLIFLVKYFPYNKPYPPTAGCFANPDWFTQSIASPLEGSNSPFANIANTTNCDFHQWAWQKFLYLTSVDPSNNKLQFENLIQVDNHLNILGDTIILDDTTQAGSGATLLDKTNNPIYYAIFTNPIMYDFSIRHIQSFFALYSADPASFNANLKNSGYDTLNYPIGSFEVKTSWILASSLGTDSLNYYRTSAKVSSSMQRVALLGMHIVGRVINHPEFIWATFEHDNLAPTAQWASTQSGDDTLNNNSVLSTNSLLFYNEGLSINECNIVADSTSFKSVFNLFDHGTQPLYSGIPDSIKRQDSSNLLNIKNINASVFSWIRENSLIAKIWKNYTYKGAIWTDPQDYTLKPGNSTIGVLDSPGVRGSRAISNIAMETYAQYNNPIDSPFVFASNNSMNCFGCHGTQDNSSFNYNLALSHLFINRLDSLISLGGNMGMKLPKTFDGRNGVFKK